MTEILLLDDVDARLLVGGVPRVGDGALRVGLGMVGQTGRVERGVVVVVVELGEHGGVHLVGLGAVEPVELDDADVAVVAQLWWLQIHYGGP